MALIGGAVLPGHIAPASHVHPAAGSAGLAPAPATPSAGTVSTGKLLGQRIMVGVRGTRASSTLLADVRAGRVGSVILFSANIVSRSQLRALTGSLQAAARAGGNPPLLISTDQEGGQVKRLPAGPPNLSPPQIAARGAPRSPTTRAGPPAAT